METNKKEIQIETAPVAPFGPKYLDFSAPRVLEIAAEEMRDRAAKRDSDEGERSMAKTVQIFNTLTGKGLSEEQGWLFMVALKLVRGSQGEFHHDDYVDAAAYCALQGEAAQKEYTQRVREDHGIAS